MNIEKPHCDFVTGSLVKLVRESLKLEYITGTSRITCLPGKELEWSVLPYTAIVAMGECDAIYAAEVKGRGIIKMTAGSVLIIPAGVEFRFELNAPAILNYLFVSFTVFDNIDVFSFLEYPWLIESPFTTEILPVMEELIACGMQIKEKSSDLFCVIREKQTELRMMELLFRYGKLRWELERKLADIHRIEPVVNYMNVHLSEAIDRSTLAAVVNLSETRFHYVFKEIMGSSPMKYLMMQRFQKAQKMLLTTNASVAEIAEAVGFENMSNFCRLFKKYYHVTPLQYRRSPIWSLDRNL